jgi:hypothetical protein
MLTGIITISFYAVLFLTAFIISKILEKRQYKFIKMVSYASKYVENFCYKGKFIKLNLIKDDVTPKCFDTSYNYLRTYTLFVNDNPVVSLWEIDALSKKTKMIMNKNYDTKGLFKILKAYKKEYDKTWDVQYKTTYVTNKRAMY